MENIKIKDYLGNKFEGNWNGKFYSSNISETKRIYINNKVVIIKNEDVDKIAPIDKANSQVIYNYFSKLNTAEREELLTYLSINLKKEHLKENNLYVNNFENTSITYLLVEDFKKMDFENKVKCFSSLKNDYYNQKSLEQSRRFTNS